MRKLLKEDAPYQSIPQDEEFPKLYDQVHN